MSSLSKSILTTLASQVVTQILSIIAGVFITRLLGVEGRGYYAIFYADVSLFTTILGFSINLSIVHFTAKSKLDLDKILSICLLFVLFTVIITLFILWLSFQFSFSDFLFPNTHVKTIYFVWFISFLLVSQVNLVFTSIFQGLRRFDVVNKVSVINSVMNVGIFLLMFTFNKFGILNVTLSTVLYLALLILVINFFQWHFHFTKVGQYNFNFNLSLKKEIIPFITFTGIGHLSNVVSFFNYRFVLWVLAYKLNAKSIGVFSLGSGLTQMLSFLSIPLSQVLMPYLSVEEGESKVRVFLSFARLHFSIILLIGLIGVLLVPFLIPLIYGEEFRGSVPVFSIIVWGIIIVSQNRVIAGFFFSEGKIWVNLLTSVFGFLITILLNLTLVDYFGVIGASVAQSLTYLSVFILFYVLLIKEIGIRNLNLFFVNKSDLSKFYTFIKNRFRN